MGETITMSREEKRLRRGEGGERSRGFRASVVYIFSCRLYMGGGVIGGSDSKKRGMHDGTERFRGEDWVMLVGSRGSLVPQELREEPPRWRCGDFAERAGWSGTAATESPPHIRGCAWWWLRATCGDQGALGEGGHRETMGRSDDRLVLWRLFGGEAAIVLGRCRGPLVGGALPAEVARRWLWASAFQSGGHEMAGAGELEVLALAAAIRRWRIELVIFDERFADFEALGSCFEGVGQAAADQHRRNLIRFDYFNFVRLLWRLNYGYEGGGPDW